MQFMSNNEKDDAGWRQIIGVSGSDETATGVVEPIRGTEAKPCVICRSWEKNEKKLIEHLKAKGLEVNPDGSFTTPIAKDIPGRVSLRIYPKRSGFCRLQTQVTEDLATCEHWEPVRFASELASRI